MLKLCQQFKQNSRKYANIQAKPNPSSIGKDFLSVSYITE